MKNQMRLIVSGFCIIWLVIAQISGQSLDSIWSLNECIEYSLRQNISIQQTELVSASQLINLEQARASRFPSFSALADQNFALSKAPDSLGIYGDFMGSNSTSVGINSSVRLYNGLKTENSIKQATLGCSAAQYDIETIKETVSLNVLNAYLQVLYAEEQVRNSEKQIESTSGQLSLASERLALGAISKSDYLVVKSELASEKLTLANALSLAVTSRVNLMQLMELPVSNNFMIEHPNFEDKISTIDKLNTDSVYVIALETKPQIKSSEINQQIAALDVSIAKAAYQPSLTLRGGLSTGYSSGNEIAFNTQIQNRVNPNLGLSLSIPIYQNRQALSGVALARIGNQNAELETLNAKNQLRKEVEQVCADIISANMKYEASREQYYAIEEAYNVAAEKYSLGLLNSVDFLIQKTNQITAESELLQSKYNLVFTYKILDFYLGKTLTF
jgi:outer membrane protein